MRTWKTLRIPNPSQLSQMLVPPPRQITNLFENPNLLELSTSGAHLSGNQNSSVFFHPNTVSTSVPHPTDQGRGAIRVVAAKSTVDTHICPGGRQEVNTFRLGMKAGRTYTFRCKIFLPAALTGNLAKTHLTISPGWTIAGENIWNSIPSKSAHNSYGSHEIIHTFTVPSDASAAWIRLVSGMNLDGGEVIWSDFQLTETATKYPYFDGSTEDTSFVQYQWSSTQNNSVSTRNFRSGYEIFKIATGSQSNFDALVEEVKTAGLLPAELKYLLLRVQTSFSKSTFKREWTATILALLGKSEASNRLFASLDSAGYVTVNSLESLANFAFLKKDWASAEAYLRRALELEPNNFNLSFRLSACLDKQLRLQESAEISKNAAKLDPTFPFDIEEGLALDPKSIWARRQLAEFVRGNLDEIQRRAIEIPPYESRLAPTRPIFTYWQQGFKNAPALVQRCHESVLENHPSKQVHTLDATNLHHYVDIPQFVIDRVGQNHTHMSDIIRLDLLAKHGGYWVDATCLISEPIPTARPDLVDQSMFFFNYSGSRIASWFMSARPNEYSVILLREALYLWWERNTYLLDYFLLHLMVEMLVEFDPRFKSDWQKNTHEHPRKSLTLQKNLMADSTVANFEGALGESWIHKLTYKLDFGKMSYQSVASAIVRGEHRK